MRRTFTTLPALTIAGLAIAVGTASAQADLAGRWSLNRDASQLPREIGFGINWQTGGTGDHPGGGRGRGADEGGSSRNFVAPRESAEDATRLRTLTDEARTPPEQLTVVQTPAAITLTGDGGWTRTVHPTGRQEVLRLEGDVPLVTVARWEGDRLVVTYDVEENRQLRYTYSVSAGPEGPAMPRGSANTRQLVVEAKFLDRGKGDAVKRVYDQANAAASATGPSAPGAAASATGPSATGAAASATAPAASRARTAIPQATAPKPDLAPGAELKALATVGLVIEEPGSQAVACGVTRDALDRAAAKSLSSGGLKIVRNTDEDTYLYVNVMAANAGGACVSRYDVTFYTHTTATLPYSSTPALVQVELLHTGGMAGGAPAANAQSVVRAVTEAVDQFVARIQQANRK